MLGSGASEIGLQTIIQDTQKCITAWKINKEHMKMSSSAQNM